MSRQARNRGNRFRGDRTSFLGFQRLKDRFTHVNVKPSPFFNAANYRNHRMEFSPPVYNVGAAAAARALTAVGKLHPPSDCLVRSRHARYKATR